MFNGKRGEMPTLEEIVKFIPHLVLAIFMIFILTSLYQACSTKYRDQSDFDFDRVVTEIKELKEGESISVPIKGELYVLTVFQEESTASKFNCGGKTCIALYKEKYDDLVSPNRKEIFKKAGKVDGGRCDSGFCISSIILNAETQVKTKAIRLKMENKIISLSLVNN